MCPIISESEIRTCVKEMNESRLEASFVYVYAAVTINLTRTEPIQICSRYLEANLNLDDPLTESS